MNMTKQIIPSVPPLTIARFPNWYHEGGNRILIKGYNGINTKAREMILGSKNIKIEISLSPQTGKEREWIFKYKINHGPILTFIDGFIIMTTEDMKTAFGLSGDCNAEEGQGILDVCGGDVAKEGKYIRYKEFLNIPGPGYGWDGDPNVSIWVGKDLKNMLQEFMEMFDKD